MLRQIHRTRLRAFTLAELLITLVVLGVIAAFAIPKVLQSQQESRYDAAGKEAIATIAQAYQRYQVNNTPTSATAPADLLPYLNYVRKDTVSDIDSKFTVANSPCTGSSPCFLLHSGGYLQLNSSSFGGTASTNAIEFFFDPDGVYSGTTNGPGKSVNFFMYLNGRIVTRGTTLPNTQTSTATFATPNPGLDPPWFSWD